MIDARSFERRGPWLPRRGLVAFFLAAMLATCTTDHTPTGPGRGGRAVLAIRPVLVAPVNLAAFGFTIDSVRAVIIRPASDTVVDTTAFFDPNSATLKLELTVDLRASTETFYLSLQLRAGTRVFYSGVDTTQVSAGPPDTSSSATVVLKYVGPGAGITHISIAPKDSVLTLAGTKPYRVSADSSGVPVSAFFVHWSTSDTVLASIDSLGVLHAPARRGSVLVRATTPNNISDSTPVTFIPVPTAVAVVSGNGQTGVVATRLPLPLRVQVVASDAQGVKGIAVRFRSLSGGSVRDSVVTTDASGFAADSATLGTVAGPQLFEAGVTSLKPDTIGVTATAGAISAAQSVVTVSGASVVSGTAATLTLQAKDAFGNNLTTGGALVAFTAAGGTSTGSVGPTTDHNNGTYTTTFTGLVAGTATTIGATINGTAVTTTLPTLTVTPGAISATTSLVSVSSTSVASGTAVTLTLQAKDAAGNSLTTGGASVTFNTSGGTSTGTFSAVTDLANGTYTASFTGLVAGTATTIGAAINSTAVTTTLPTVSVTAGAISAATSVVTTTSGAVASGASATLTLQAKDAAGNALTTGGATIVFVATGGTSTGTIATVVDHGNGTYSATFTGVIAGTATTIGAKVNGTATVSTTAITVVPGNAVTAQSIVSVSSGTVTSGGAVTLTLQARDSVGNPIATGGLTVVFTNSGGTSTGTISTTTDHANGTYTATFTATLAGTATTIGATIGGAPVTSTLPTVTVTAGAASPATSVVTVSSGTVASGLTLTLTLQAKDAAGNALSTGGSTVVFTATGGTSTGTIGATTDHATGTYTATFTAVLAGSATTIGATINTTAVTSTLPTVTVSPGAISPAKSVVTVTAATVLQGGVDTLLLQARDAAGNTLTSGGALVVFTQSGGTSFGSISATTDLGNGTYRALFTGTTTGTPTTIGATINAVTVTSTPLPTVQVTATVHSVDITADSTWTVALSPHIVNGYLRIRNGATLTIQPGVVVKFNAGAGLQVGDTALNEAGGLILDGTASSITLTANTASPTPGFWKGIEVQLSLPVTVVRRSQIEWAGGTRANSNNDACILVVNSRGAPLDLDSLHVRQCVFMGIGVFGGTAHVHRSEIDTITGAFGAGVRAVGGAARMELDSTTITSSSTGLDLTGAPIGALAPSSGNRLAGIRMNAAQLPGLLRQDSVGGVILLFGGRPDSTVDSFTVFRQPGSAGYQVLGLLDVGTVGGQTIVLDSNLVMQFPGQAGILVGDSAGIRKATIRSLGTNGTNAPRLTSSRAVPAPGDWYGLEIGRLASTTRLANVRIEFAGDSLPGRTVHRAGLWVRNPAAVPFALDSAQIFSSGSAGAIQNSAGVVVTAKGGGVDIRRTVSASNAGSGFAFNVPLKLIDDTARANSLYGLDAAIDGGSQVTAADSIVARLGPGNLYPAQVTPGVTATPGPTPDMSGNLRDTLLLDGGSLTVSGGIGTIPGIAWRVLGPIVIDSGAALVLDVDTVAFDDSAAIIVGGAAGAGLRSLRSSVAPVLLTATPGHTRWIGLEFKNLSQPDTLANVVVEKAGVFIPPPPSCRFQLECFSVLLGSIRFTNSSSFGLLLDSVTVRNAIAYAVEALPTGTGAVTIRHSQFYENPALFHASTGAALTVTQSDISHYGRVVVVNNSFTPGDSVDATNNWWGDVAGVQAGSGGRDTLSLGQTAGYQTKFVPFATTPFFPGAIGPAASIVPLGVDSVQGVQAGAALLDLIRARVLDASGRGVSGQVVGWATNKLSVSPLSSTTDVGGRAGTFWTVGTVAETDTARASSGALTPARFLVNVLPGPTVPTTVDWQVLPSRTLADSVHSHPGVGTDTIFYSSTNHTSAFKTNARDGFGNITQPSTGPLFDQGPCSNAACRFPAADSVRGDTVYFRPPAIGDYVISGLYDGGTGGSDQVVLRVTPVAAGVRIDRNDTIPGVQSVPDSALFTSLCPVSGPFNALCRREFHAFVVDTGGTALGNQNARFQWISPAFPDTIVTIDQTRGAPANDSALVSVHANGKRFVVAVDTASTSATHLKRDSLSIVVIQTPVSLVVTPDTVSRFLGDTVRFKAVALDAGGDTVPANAIHWRIEPPYQGTLAILDTSLAGQVKVRLDTVILGQGQIEAFTCCGAGGLTDTLVAKGVVTAFFVVANVSAGSGPTCGLTSVGTAYCWGYNADGEVGDGTTTTRLTPALVTGGLTFASLGGPSGPGAFHACGVTTAGAAYCWGYNGAGELGDGTTIGRSSPVAVTGGLQFGSVSAAAFHTCGLTLAGVAYCWGSNDSGQLGDGTTTNRRSPVAVMGGLTFTSITAGYEHTCGLTQAGAAYCWGSNGDGQLGDGTTVERLTPVAVTAGPVLASIAAGSYDTCGLTPAGAAYCWGENTFGSLGDGTNTNRLTPVAVAGGLSFQSFTVGNIHGCGLTAAGAAYCWGWNGSGELGDGTTVERVTPVAVTGGLTFANLSGGGGRTCGTTLVGVAYCWGANDTGQLGNGTTINRMIPTPVAHP